MATVRKRRWGSGKSAWEVSYTDEDGKRRREKCCSKKAADIRRVNIEHDIEIGTHVAMRETVTVAQAADAWLEDCQRRHRVKDKMSGGTLRLYRDMVRNHVGPELGAIKLAKLTSERVQRFVDNKAEKYKRQHETARDVLKRILDFSVRKKWLKRNPLVDEAVKIPPRNRKPANPPSIEDMRTVFETLEVRQYNEKTPVWEQRRVFFCLSSLTGMRRGEVFALHWEDLDYEKGVICVRRSYSPSDGFKEPKTKAGTRRVPLHPLLVRALQPVWERRGKPRNGLILQTCHGKPAYGGAYEGWFKITMRHAGMLVPGNGIRTDQQRDRDKEPKWTIHEMRHFAVSLWIAADVPILEVSRMAGHADINTTLQIYGHLFEEHSKAKEGVGFAANAIMPTLRETTYLGTPTCQGRAKGVAQLEKPKALIELQRDA